MRPILYTIVASWLFGACDQPATNNPKNAVTTSTPVSSCAPEITDQSWYASGKKAPLLTGLAGMHFAVSTSKEAAQQYFDQGLMLSFAFNHAEAARSFTESTRQDSNCAMSWWGLAYVLGPNYNGGMEKDNFQRAYEAVQKAQSLAASSTPKEKDLIAALTQRYTSDTAIGRPVLDSLYAVAMRKVYQQYPADVTIASLFAESLMDLHPWNLWTKDGRSQPWTPEIIAVLEKGLKAEPRHAGANHFYIHATEMSPHAAVALPSADLLRDLVPGSGHLVHMPSHTYIRTGRYHEGVVANQQAALKDSLYMEACHAQGVYPLAYYPHNYHFLSACATLDGESKAALQSALATASHAHKKLLQDPAWSTLQHYYTIPWYVEVKLGLWNDLLHAPAPDTALKYPSVIWHYAQGMAQLAQNKVRDAREHLAWMTLLMSDPALKELSIWGINNLFDLCVIAYNTLEGEILAKEKNFPAAIALLTKAVALEDALNYDEPPDWFFSVRHHLGAVLLEAGNPGAAIAVYKKDLQNYRNNGWALKGLMNAYEQLGDRQHYETSRQAFNKSWQYADITISSSRVW